MRMRVFVMAAAAAGAAAAAFAGEEDVVVLANQNVAGSVGLAQYYMKARGIPEDRLCVLDLPEGEAISRVIYEDRLRDPFLEFLREHKWVDQVQRNPQLVRPDETPWTTQSSTVRYVVLMRGIPLQIADTRLRLVGKVADRFRGLSGNDSASVESELMLALMPPYPIKGPSANPFFQQLSFDDAVLPGQAPLVVTRLDGPDVACVRRMIDDAIFAETCGLHGRAYFDSRGVLDQSSYALGDYWIREACERFAREGYECMLDRQDPVWGIAYPMEDVAVYMGWYEEHAVGPFERADFRFRRGAVAYHLHSSSAATLRSGTQFWAGPLLARGAAVTMGAVGEPLLRFTPQLNVFADRLCTGRAFGLSAAMSIPAASWRIAVVGDPLYRPFRHTVDEQIAQLEKEGRPEVEWAYVRKINQFVREGRFNPALDLCREQLKKRDSLVLREKLGDLYAKNELYSEAGVEYEAVIDKAVTAETAVRVAARWLTILLYLGEREKADRLEAAVRERWKGSPVLPWLETARK